MAKTPAVSHGKDAQINPDLDTAVKRVYEIVETYKNDGLEVSLSIVNDQLHFSIQFGMAYFYDPATGKCIISMPDNSAGEIKDFDTLLSIFNDDCGEEISYGYTNEL